MSSGPTVLHFDCHGFLKIEATLPLGPTKASSPWLRFGNINAERDKVEDEVEFLTTFVEKGIPDLSPQNILLAACGSVGKLFLTDALGSYSHYITLKRDFQGDVLAEWPSDLEPATLPLSDLAAWLRWRQAVFAAFHAYLAGRIDGLRRRLRFLSRIVAAILRLMQLRSSLRDFVLVQSAWFPLHGAHPPRNSDLFIGPNSISGTRLAAI